MQETFGRYQLLKKLATGGMGQVFLARQLGLVGFEKLVVVKRILPHLSEDQDFINMFFDEARIAALLNHPNIAQIYDLGEVEGIFYIAMEYVHGDSLRAVNHQANALQGGMPLPLKLRVVADAAGALDAAHRARGPAGQPLSLIHRDVSPQNILVGFNGSVKLIDFGVAKATGKISTTLTGAIKGKYAYMSPEQARGEELDHRSDIFGLGIVFYEILTSTRLFKRESDTATMKAVVAAKIEPPSSIVKGIPKAIDVVVMKALARRRQDRFQSAAELQLAIEDYLVRQRLASTPSHLAAYMQKLYAHELASPLEQGVLPTGRTPSKGRPAGGARTPSAPKSASSPGSAGSRRRSAPAPEGTALTPSGKPLDLAERDRRIAAATDHSIHGLLFNALLAEVERLSGATATQAVRAAAGEPGAYIDSRSYPAAQFLRCLWKAAERLVSRTADADGALSALGAACAAGVVRAASEKTTVPGIEPLRGRLLALVTALDALAPPSLHTLETAGQGEATIRFRNDVLPPRFYVGLLRQAAQGLLGARPAVTPEEMGPVSALYRLRW